MKQTNFKTRMTTLVVMSLGWLLISGLMLSLSYAGLMNIRMTATIVAVSMCLLPLRQITSMLFPWLIEYLCSVNNYLNQRLEKFLITKDMDPYATKASYKNAGIERIFQAVIWIFWIFIAALLSFLSPVTTSRVRILFHQLSMFIPRITGNALEKLGFVLYIPMTLATIVVICVLIGKLYQNTLLTIQKKPLKHNIPRTALHVIIYLVIKHVFNYVFFAYPLALVFQDMLFWCGLILITFIGIGLFLLINAILTA